MKTNTLIHTLLLAGALLSTVCQQLPARKKDKTLNVATFNIRYDCGYDHGNEWSQRRDTVAALVRHNNWHLVGMQEVLHNQLTDLLERLPDYGYVGVGREDGRTKGEYSALFYHKGRFELIDKGHFWLSQYPDSAGFIGWDGACSRIASWAKLKDRNTGRQLVFLNTHFDHIGKVAMREAAHLVMSRLDSLTQGLPLILTGDLNVDDQSESYHILTHGTPHLNDAYKLAPQREGPDYTYHNFGRLPAEQRRKIDFILTSDHIKVYHSAILQEHSQTTGHVSDHNPHWCHIRIQ